ncbi:MAG: SUMF1/EgtB/PvdO family nonheme iron enzyme, partial [Nitrospinaceae bacterium]|nr:formylglycine-generating enzyme family protein [Nitrospinaceae bacterium]NIR53548.1 formylglycine-generating enzyme family protein [Nitrospinaceae bacterium]NIS83949.1 formylglycine-generating enzyme family protein [Nitrospinaceae bacterium]NIT80758.1 formylglycine-generating enzyme family protein [Nitrospinaceae bacterium]NIU43064.1 formylglycine-generating enzyme family protein [Nitrospinaceae bacterium]
AEWEKAARAGTQTPYYWGNEIDGAYVWYKGNSELDVHPVGQKKPNSYGLFDMAGNVAEWVSDWYGQNYYDKSPVVNPQGPTNGIYRVIRGGSRLKSFDLQHSHRSYDSPGRKIPFRHGFRCAK